ncbi:MULTISPECIES: helix-turn-helix domain-containing protein [unclassified Paenibacillus]|uniref:ArsR/SmtB family transcription factor n=1 Tax=unclassified Paenibacillus TaxID=185978 RepID=UPI000953C4C9|nr:MULTISPECIES: helix-turn-helix domain-containing protein [unclassified Paenibacillus]ASS64782.1 helix-turn-helix domain-containing protein [Paenibacillus sp. RUD330]SIR06185.1 Predicted transcriptional regulator [Paenibacillus sp. RU4X]SIR29293.1 Predicted transcriptional regulator [Paenibacillus sp. RU4T]
MSETKQELIRYPASRMIDVAKALSSDVRLRILEALGEKPMSVSQLAEVLGAAQPTISINVQTLEQAELIACRQGSAREKICSVNYRSILLEMPARAGDALHRTEQIRMPIGMFSACSVQPPCGMASRDGSGIGSPDDPRVFYMPDRIHASVVWFSGSGSLEYRFANLMPPGTELEAISLTAELCSEAPGFREEWPSDISLYMNDLLVGTWTSPGDFGGRKGRFTPEKWRGNTEYGLLTEWKVTRTGSLINGASCGDLSIDALGLSYSEPVRIRFEIAENAANARGLNLFGSDFGDHAQDIVLSFTRKAEPGE